MAQEDIKILELLLADDESALDLLFDHYYSFLCNVVFRVINDAVYAEDIVQEMFTDIWHKRHDISIKTSLRAYLRRAAVNRSINHIRKQRMKFDETEEAVVGIEANDVDGQVSMERDELEKRIFECIENLPPKCKLIFGMSRYESMSYQEIADSLDISIKTVENQISKALKLLRLTVQHYLV